MNNIQSRTSSQRVRLRLMLLFLVASLLFVLYFVALASLPNNPVALKSNSRFHVISFLPEGWAFFTRNAREDVLYVYKKQPDGHWELVNVPGSSLRFIFGLNRKGRAIGPEIAVLLRQLNDEDWLESRYPVSSFFKTDTLRPHIVNNTAPDPACSGDLIFQLTPPIPWAWAGSGKEIIMPYKIIRLYVKPANNKN
ncbi:SdpA family antimicrobial peptide system protein [Chitinophaga pendula]|uniref:SdpA family antimicrobial peptide system protein n=1 Tax=Chitinophaga TaxID=79328 RepID=UPI0012FD79F1|nr:MULTISPECIES: SdpA family antimicrobial peptide system protein [Chitinophaga]UCJ08207.1 SdpA family antimicrobial peptide system protein [Chitinophaga pendula]